MSTHHAATALRYLQEDPDLESADHAYVHAQLETAAQIERLANQAQALVTAGDSIVEFFREAFPAILAMIGSGGLSFGVKTTDKKPFDPEQN